MEYFVNLDRFQGPFDLLFYLIEKNEVDISDIPISEITKQYLNYLDKMREFNMNVTSEFVLMASTLLEIKSKMLLPVVVEQEDPRQNLINQLIEYKLFKQAAEELKEKEEDQSLYITKPKEDISIQEKLDNEQLILNEINVYDLLNIFKNLMKDNIIEEVNHNEVKLFRENYNVQDCVNDLLEKIKEFKKLSLFSIIKSTMKKEYIVVVFLSILELSKMKDIKIFQNNVFSDINIVYCTKG